MKVNVNVENFTEAETSFYIKKFYKKIGKTNIFFHFRDFNVGNAVIRMNLDTLYSIAIIDSRKHDIILNIPNLKDRYFSCCILDYQHYETFFTNQPGEYIIKKNPRCSCCLVRILVKKPTQKELKLVNSLQDQFHIEAQDYSKSLEFPDYDKKSYEYTKDLIAKLFRTAPMMTSINMFGKKNEVNQLKHLMGTEFGWGGLSSKHAIYESFIPKDNDGKQEYQLVLKSVPVKAFWSITVYDENGFLLPNKKSSLNNFTSIKNRDNSYTINFSNNPNKVNSLNITKNWNYTLRLYEPRDIIQKNKWKYPKPQKIN